ncbi:MATE family efflux transporter, partial [uncultured Dubosiella sp.]
YERVRILFLTMLRWTILAGLAATAVFELVPGFLISLFGANGELYVEFATACLRIYLSLIVLTCVQKVCAIFLQSIGKAALAAPLAIVRDVLLLVFSIVLPMHLGVQGIFFAAPIADIAAMLITVPVMMKIWHELKLPQNRQYEPVARLETDTND